MMDEFDLYMAAAVRCQEGIRFHEALRKTVLQYGLRDTLHDQYAQRGCLAARVVEMAGIEIGRNPLEGWPTRRFLSSENNEGRMRAARAAELFAQALQLRAKESRFFWKRRARFDGHSKHDTGYHTMLQKLRPSLATVPLLLELYEQSYIEEATRLRLDSKSPSQGEALVKAAPRRIRGITLDYTEDETSPKQKKEGVQEAERPLCLLTEFGVILPLAQLAHQGYVLPRTVTSLEERTRAENARAPREEEFTTIIRAILANIGLQTCVDF